MRRDGDGDFSFHDLISIVNPLQHIPIVSTLYRAVTGDSIKPLERIAGDTLYGGAWGFVSSVANLAFKDLTGKDFGETALALVEGDDTTAVADNVNRRRAVFIVHGGRCRIHTRIERHTRRFGRRWTADGAAVFQDPQERATTNDAAMLALMNFMTQQGHRPHAQPACVVRLSQIGSAPPMRGNPDNM